jgi:very-short-patch-repair endonuclease
MTYCKKLIEVALPLEAINKESAREKSIRHGHPSTLHLWWARRPLAACRAVLFASLVDDPSSHPDHFPTEEAQEKERLRLFEIIEKLVNWDNINNQQILAEAKAEILKSTNNNSPPVYDPFCGGGSIPLEAQRLGLEAHGSDLNPVAVLITKALIEIPPKFANQPAVNPDSRKKSLSTKQWYGAQGLAEDVRYYGQWMRDEAQKRIGHLYPKVSLTPQPPLPLLGEGEYERWEVPDELRQKMKELARQFRKEPTKSEALLWEALRNRKLEGRKFRRQQPFGPFVVDFFCAAERLVVEVDGPMHESQQDLDCQRQKLLELLGLHFVRLSSQQVETDLTTVLDTIRRTFTPLSVNKSFSLSSPPLWGGTEGG